MTEQIVEKPYKVAEVADILGVSKMTIYRLIDGEELGHMRIGRNIRVPQRALRNYINNAETPAKS